MEFCLGDESVLAGDLHDARVKWYFIGGHLKIKDSDLKAIEAEYPKLERQLLEMIVVWLKRAEPSTCEELLAALMMSNVGEEQLASKLSEKYNCQLPASSEGTHTGGCTADLQAQLSNDLQTIQRKFAALLSNTRRSLRNHDLNDVATCAIDLAFIASNKNISLLGDHKDDILKATSVNQIFNILTAFWSFFNYDLLEHIIEGCDVDKTALRDYQDALKVFCKRRVSELPQIFLKGVDFNRDKVWVKMELNNPTLREINNLKGRIAQILEVPVSGLFLNDIQSGCVQLEFLVPQCITAALFPLTEEQIHNLQQQANVLTLKWRNGKGDLKTLFDLSAMPTDETITTAKVGWTSVPGPDDLKPVIRKRKMLKSTFKSLVSDTRKEMKSKYKVSEFRESFIHGLSYSLKTKQKKYFKDAHLSTLSTFDDIFSAFNNYWDYLNYGLLDIIVKKYLKRPKLVTKMNEYGDDVKAFRSATAVKVFQRAQKSKPLIEPPGFRLVASKHDISPDATLEEIHNLHLRMTQEAELEMFALSIPEVMIGSVFITWLVPESAINDLMFVLTPPLLKELHIEAITRRHSTPLTKQPSRKEMAEVNKLLLEASKKGEEEKVRALLEKGADLQARESDKHHWSPLMWASRNNHLGTVEILLNHPSSDLMIDAQDTKYWTAFLVACSRGHLEIVKLLLEHGANINHQNHEGWSGLMWAASRNGNLSVAQHLLACGADTELQDHVKWTALMLTSQFGHTDIAKELLERGANPNIQDKNGMCALVSASKHGHVEIVRLLSQHGAQVNLKKKNGLSSLHIATLKNNDDVVQELCHCEGVDVNIQDQDELTPLMIAAQKGKNAIVNVLLKGKADPNIQAMKASGWTALFMAVDKHKTEVVTTLLDNGADPKIKDTNGVTAVDIAVPGILNFLSKGMYKILLDASGLTEQEHKKQSRERAGRVELSLKQIAHWYRLIEDRLLPEKAAKREAHDHTTGLETVAVAAVY